jgi:hypothetical protein
MNEPIERLSDDVKGDDGMTGIEIPCLTFYQRSVLNELMQCEPTGDYDNLQKSFIANVLPRLLAEIDTLKGEKEACVVDSDPITKAYAQYDSDRRVCGSDDRKAFTDAVRPALTPLLNLLTELTDPFTVVDYSDHPTLPPEIEYRLPLDYVARLRDTLSIYENANLHHSKSAV